MRARRELYEAAKGFFKNATFKNFLSAQFRERFFIFVFILISLGILVRNISIYYPLIMGDEYIYSVFSRLVPFSEASRPNYLYFALYYFTAFLGPAFLNGAKLLNLLFFCGSMPFIYWTARTVCSKNISFFIMICVLAGPFNIYTVVFMPEVLYFFSFWIFSYFILTCDRMEFERPFFFWGFAGVLLGVASLVKPHALFILFVIPFYIGFSPRANGDGRRKIIFVVFFSVCFILITLATKMFLGWFFAGRVGVTFFGTVYTGIAETAMKDSSYYFLLIMRALENLGGHIMALCILFGVPLGAMLLVLVEDSQVRETVYMKKIAIYTLFLILSLVPITAIFTASVADAGPYESVYRLHFRYYNFIFPFLFILSSVLFKYSLAVKKSMSWVLVGVFFCAAFALFTRMSPFMTSFMDNPELRGILAMPSVWYVWGTLSLISIASLFFRVKISGIVYLFALLPILVVSFAFDSSIYSGKQDSVYDRAGIFARQNFSEILPKLKVVASDPAGSFRTLFHIDTPSATIETLPNAIDKLDLSTPERIGDWYLVIGDFPVKTDASWYVWQARGFALYGRYHPLAEGIDFSRTGLPLFIKNAQGLSGAEPWGRWSDADVAPSVRFEFFEPLPDRFTLELEANAFGPNIGKDLTVNIGSRTYSVKIPEWHFTAVLDVDLGGERADMMEFLPPSPASPKELGLSEDGRRLGIGFISMRIKDLQKR